jgi:hypothetical protein
MRQDSVPLSRHYLQILTLWEAFLYVKNYKYVYDANLSSYVVTSKQPFIDQIPLRIFYETLRGIACKVANSVHRIHYFFV